MKRIVGITKIVLDKIYIVLMVITVVAIFAAAVAALGYGAFWLYNTVSLSWVLFTVIGVETAIIAVLAYYIKKFATLVMICEDDYGDVIETLISTEKSINKILSLQLFFDSIEIKKSVDSIMDEVKANRIDIIQMAERFVERSQQKYETVNMSIPPPPIPGDDEGPSAVDSILDSAAYPQPDLQASSPQINPRGQHIVRRNYRNYADGEY